MSLCSGGRRVPIGAISDADIGSGEEEEVETFDARE